MTTFFRVNVPLSTLQLHLYQSIINRDSSIVNNPNETENAIELLNGTITQLKQCCNHPYLFKGIEDEQREAHMHSIQSEPHWICNCAKLLFLDRLVIKIQSNNQNKQKILICCTMKEMLKYLEQWCNYRGLRHCRTSNADANCVIFLHHTENQTLEHIANINHVILYDTHWTVKENEKKIVTQMESNKCDGSPLIVYEMCTDNTMEKKLFSIKKGDPSKDRNKLISLIKFNATKVLTLGTEECDYWNQTQLNIDDLICNVSQKQSKNREKHKKNIKAPPKYTLRDILQCEENQPVIRVFVGFFVAMIVIPIMTVLVLKRYWIENQFSDWSEESKQNLTIVIGAAVAHVIGVIYVCYSWSGEDRVPSHILDSGKKTN